MPFSTSGQTITQSGTDDTASFITAMQSSPIVDVTQYGTASHSTFTLVDFNAASLLVTGTLNIDMLRQLWLFSEQDTTRRLEVSPVGNLTMQSSQSRLGYNYTPEAGLVMFAHNDNVGWGSRTIHVDNGGTALFEGVMFRGECAPWFQGNTTIRNCIFEKVGNTGDIQFNLQNADNITLENVIMYADGQSGITFRGGVPTISNVKIIGARDSFNNESGSTIVIEGLDSDTGATADISQWSNRLHVIKNAKNGSRFIWANHLNGGDPLNFNQGYIEVLQTIKAKFVDTDGLGIEGVKLFIPDNESLAVTDGVNRNLVSHDNLPTTDNRDYLNTSVSSGTIADFDILIAEGASNTGETQGVNGRIRGRGKNAVVYFSGQPSPDDIFDYSAYVYGYDFETKEIIAKGADGTEIKSVLLADALITGTKAEALALTEINNPQELYDSMCAWQDDNFTGLDFRIGRQGDTVLLDSYNLVIDPSAVNVFAFDGTTITIKSSSFTGNLTTTGTVTDSSNTVVGSITDINGTTSPSSITLNAPNSNWAIYDNNGTRITSGSGNATYVNSRGTDTGTWSVVKHRKGYNSEIYTWVADDGSSNSFLFGEVPLLKPEGGNIYSGGATTGLTASVNGDNYIEVNAPNRSVSAQEIIDAQQDFLSTLDGLDWIQDTGFTSAPLFGNLNGVTYFLNIEGFQYDSISGTTPESAMSAILVSSASHSNIRIDNGGLNVVSSAESVTPADIWDYLHTNILTPDSFGELVKTNVDAQISLVETKAQADARQALLIAEHDQTQVDISNISFSDTAILSAISALNDISTADIRTELATELARLDLNVSSVAYDDTALTALVNALPTLAQMEASAALTAIADITGLSVHNAADVVTAMQVVANDFKADVSGITFDDTAILSAIAALNDIDLATIEGSSILSKEATLNTIITNLSAIPTTDSVADLAPVLTAISNLNDPTVTEIVTGLQEVSDDFKADLTGVAYDDAALISKIDVIDSIVDSILVDTNELQSNQGNFSTATGFATPSDVSNAQTAIIAEVNENETKIDLLPTSSSGYDDTNLISKIDVIDSNVDAIKLKTDTLVNTDVSAIETKSQADARQALLISEIQSGGGSTDLTPVLNAIAALNDLSVSDVEGSNLAKEATLTSIISSIASIPTTDNVADLTPVLTAIANLNDVTASEVRAAFNAVDFQDKNTEIEVHAWLDSYGNKDNWKGDSQDYTSSLTVINDGIKKASKLIPHNTDLS